MKKVFNAFFRSEYYLLFIALFTILNWTLGFSPIISGTFIFVVYSAIVFTQDDSSPLLALTIAALIMNIARTDIHGLNNAEILAELPLAYLALLAVLIIVESVYFLLRNFKFNSCWLLLGFIAIGVSMFLSGTNTNGVDVIFVYRHSDVLAYAVILFMYLILSFTNNRVDNRYFAKTLLYMGTVIAFQVFSNYYDAHSPFDSLSVKWANTNTIALILVMIIPVSAYSLLQDRINPIHVLLLFLQFLACLATLSRGGIGVLIPTFIITLIYVFKKTKKNQKKLLVLYCLLSLVLITGLCVCSWDIIKIHAQHFLDKLIEEGIFDSSGRWDGPDPLYPKAIEAFKNNRLLGEGTNYSASTDAVVGFYHSTVLDIMAKLGLVGCVAYGFHFIQKYFILLFRRNTFKTLVLFGMLGSGLYGLIDVSYFNFVYLFILVLILGQAERSPREDLMLPF